MSSPTKALPAWIQSPTSLVQEYVDTIKGIKGALKTIETSVEKSQKVFVQSAMRELQSVIELFQKAPLTARQIQVKGDLAKENIERASEIVSTLRFEELANQLEEAPYLLQAAMIYQEADEIVAYQEAQERNPDGSLPPLLFDVPLDDYGF